MPPHKTISNMQTPLVFMTLNLSTKEKYSGQLHLFQTIIFFSFSVFVL